MNTKFQMKWGFYSRAILFCLINLILVNGSLIILGKDPTLLNYARDTILARPSFADSWDPMNRALKAFASGEDPSIYQKVFFDQKHKFQYPPTSLEVIKVIKKVVGEKIALSMVMDWISWIFIIGTVIFTTLLFYEGIRQYIPEEAVGKFWLTSLLAILFSFTFYPLLRGYILGQIQTWLTFLFTLGLWLWFRNRKALTGICIGIISVIKPQMGLYLLWGLIRKNGKFCLMIGGIAAVFLGISIFHFGILSHFKYLEVLSFIAERGETYYPNQSVNGLVNRLLMNGNNLEWDAWNFAPPNVVVRLTTMLTSTIFISAAMFLKKNLLERDSWLGFATAGLLFTLASPVAWEHHYGILLPIFALAFPKTWQLRKYWKSGLIWLATAYLLTANLFLFANLTAATSWNFLQSYMFFGGLILLGVLIKLQLLTERIE